MFPGFLMPGFLFAAGAAAAGGGVRLAEGRYGEGAGLIVVSVALVAMRIHMATGRGPWR